MSASDLGTTALRQMANCNLTKANIAISGVNAPTYKTTVALTYIINGVLYSPGPAAAGTKTLAVIPGAPALYTIPAQTTCYLLLVVNPAGTMYAVQGDFKGRDLTSQGLVAKGDGNMPEAPVGYAPFGLIKIVTNAGQTFLPASDLLDNTIKAAVSYFDLAMVPAGNL